VPGVFLNGPASRVGRYTALQMLSHADFGGIQLICEALSAVRDTGDMIPAALQAVQRVHSDISREQRELVQAKTPQTRTTAERSLSSHRTQLANSPALNIITTMADSKGFELNQAHNMLLPKESDYFESMCHSLAGRYSLASRALSDATRVQAQYRQEFQTSGRRNTGLESYVFARTLAAVVDMAGPEDEEEEEEEEED